MSSSSSPGLLSSMDNPNDENNEHTIKNRPNSKTASEKSYMPCAHSLGGRNLIVCIDGTSNQFGDKNTNVIELYNLILKDEHNQRTWYNSGIGTYARPSWRSLSHYKKVLYHKIDLAIAWDFERTILGAYSWLSDNYKKGDCIFLFGFSRGAFQVRVLSAMIEKVGLIYKGNEMQIPFAYELYADPKSGGHPVSNVGSQIPDSQKRPTLVDRFKKIFSKKNGHSVNTVGSHDTHGSTMANRFKEAFSHKNVRVHFVGAWDTVSSIGIARGKSMLPMTVDGMTHVCYFRHALALDERRVKFLPEYAYGGSAKPTDNTTESKGILPQRKEVWFAGTHSDIGGGNVENRAMDLARPPLRWMVFEAWAAGLRTSPFDHERPYERIKVIESLTWHWRFFEWWPFERLTFTRKEDGLKRTRMPHCGKGRKIHPGQKIHSALVRARGPTALNYIPQASAFDDNDENKSFWKRLRDWGKEPTANIPEWLELDLYEYSKLAVEKLVTEGAESALKSLHHTSISGDARRAVYSHVIEALLRKELTLENKHLLLHTTLRLLDGYYRGHLDFKLSPSNEIAPLLSDLFRDNTDYWRTAWDFVTLFTSFVKVVELEGTIAHAFSILTAGPLEESDPGKKLGVFFTKSLAISPYGTCIASGLSRKETIRIWDAETGSQVGEPLQGHSISSEVTSVAFSPDGMRIVSGSFDMTIRIWNTQTGGLVGEPFQGHNELVLSVAFSPDGKHVVSGLGDGTVQIWDAENGSLVGGPLQGHHDYVRSVAFSPDGKYITSGSYDKTVRIWDAGTGRPVGEPLRGHDDWVFSVAFSPDSTRIISGSRDKTVRIWDAENGSPVGGPLQGHHDYVRSVAFSPDGKHIASGSDDKTVRIWDAATGRSVGEPLRGHGMSVNFVVFSPDSRYITSVSHDGAVRIWDVEGLRKLTATRG